MTDFATIVLQFEKKGAVSGWTYIDIPADVAQTMKPGTKTSFRVRGLLDEYAVSGLALTPAGGGNFILAINGPMRKALRKNAGAMLRVRLEEHVGFTLDPSPELVECLRDAPGAHAQFFSLPVSHRNYYINWIESAKGLETKAKRIAMTVNAMVEKMDFGQMIRAERKRR